MESKNEEISEWKGRVHDSQNLIDRLKEDAKKVIEYENVFAKQNIDIDRLTGVSEKYLDEVQRLKQTVKE